MYADADRTIMHAQITLISDYLLVMHCRRNMRQCSTLNFENCPAPKYLAAIVPKFTQNAANVIVMASIG